VEPNSGLGNAIAYLYNHRDKLTVFLRVPGAPPSGARVGDVFMSLIHTCQLNS
jgi:hypothetical protein